MSKRPGVTPVLLLCAALALPSPAAAQADLSPRRTEGRIRATLQVRERLESWNGFNFGSPAGATHDDLFLLTRVLAGVRLELAPGSALFVQGKSSLATRRELAGGRSRAHVDELDLQQAYIEVRPDPSLSFRAGRQDLNFGAQRLVSALDWSNVRRAFDALAIAFRGGQARIDGFVGRPVAVRQYDFNEAPESQTFGGVYATGMLAANQLELYWLYLRSDSILLAGASGRESRHTAGARLVRRDDERLLDVEIEAALQTGSIGSSDIGAWMATVVLTRRFGVRDERPRIWLGLDYASGESGSATSIGTFNQLFPLSHAFLGYADILGRQNAVDASVGASATVAGTAFRVDVHRLWRASDSDAWYGAAGTVTRAAGAGTSRDLGTELDLTLRRTVRPGITAQAGYSLVRAGRFIEQAGSTSDLGFGYLMVTGQW